MSEPVIGAKIKLHQSPNLFRDYRNKYNGLSAPNEKDYSIFWFYVQRHSTKCTKKERKYMKEGKICEHMKNNEMILTNNTDPTPHLQQCTFTLMRSTCGHKVGFNKKVETVYLCFIFKTQLIFECLIK